METTGKTILEEIRGTVDEIIKQVKNIIKEGNARRILIKNKKGKVLFQSQLTIGAAGLTFFAIYAPIVTAITTLVLIANDVKVFVEREVDEEDDEFEVEAEVIEIKDEEEEGEEKEKKKTKKDDKKSKSDDK